MWSLSRNSSFYVELPVLKTHSGVVWGGQMALLVIDNAVRFDSSPFLLKDLNTGGIQEGIEQPSIKSTLIWIPAPSTALGSLAL